MVHDTVGDLGDRQAIEFTGTYRTVVLGRSSVGKLNAIGKNQASGLADVYGACAVTGRQENGNGVRPELRRNGLHKKVKRVLSSWWREADHATLNAHEATLWRDVKMVRLHSRSVNRMADHETAVLRQHFGDDTVINDVAILNE
jgi:hypothetical protein